MNDHKAVLAEYLQTGREALLWKMEGLSGDVRRPLVPSGTNLRRQARGKRRGRLPGDCFGRPFEQTFPWFSESADDNADMWATADESRTEIIELYHRVWEHSDATIAALSLDTVGSVAWWREGRRSVTCPFWYT